MCINFRTENSGWKWQMLIQILLQYRCAIEFSVDGNRDATQCVPIENFKISDRNRK